MRTKLVLAVAIGLGILGCKTRSSSADLSSDSSAEAPGVAPGETDETPLPEYTPRDVTEPVSEELAFAIPEIGTEAPADGFALAGSERYFMIVFGFQGTGPFNLPRYTHTWGVFLRAVGDNLATASLDHFVISWDAADGAIGLLQDVEAGRNYSMDETKVLATQNHAAVRRSRVVEIARNMFTAAYGQYTAIVSGAASGLYKYRMIDNLPARRMALARQPGGYTNCAHALSDMLVGSDGKLLETGTARGWAASDAVYQWFKSSGSIVSEQASLDLALAPRLDL